MAFFSLPKFSFLFIRMFACLLHIHVPHWLKAISWFVPRSSLLRFLISFFRLSSFRLIECLWSGISSSFRIASPITFLCSTCPFALTYLCAFSSHFFSILGFGSSGMAILSGFITYLTFPIFFYDVFFRLRADFLICDFWVVFLSGHVCDVRQVFRFILCDASQLQLLFDSS